jgi:hypothetical protein
VNRATVRWSQSAPAAEVISRWELETLLAGIARRFTRSPAGAIVTLADGTTAHIALGRAEGILVIIDPGPNDDGLTSEWLSVGDVERKGHTSFFLLDHSWDQENRSLLPTTDTIRAVGELFETGRRPTWIRWEENAF